MAGCLNCPLQPGDRFIHCPVHDIKKYRRHVELCGQRGKYWKAWEKGKGPGRPHPSRKTKLAYETEAERLELLDQHIESTCMSCESHVGSRIAGLNPVDVCTCAGCKQTGRQNVRELKQCPRKKWSLILPQ
jgi:hypothetical protein